jgi:DMSO reductase family type II enzyme chaperone
LKETIKFTEDRLVDTQISIAATRSLIYKLLAIGYSYPTLESYEDIKNGTFWINIKENIEQLSSEILNKAIFEIKDGLFLSDISFETFESEYLNAFETNMPNPSCSLYEGSYAKEVNKAGLLLELKGFYENFGLNISKNFKELEDRITVELEFMHFLTFKQVQAKEEGLDAMPYLKAQKDFLERHLGKWIPKFRMDVKDKIKFPFFRNLSLLTDAFITSEVQEAQRNIEMYGKRM